MFLLTLLGPTLYLEATGQKTESRADVLPKHGIVEYEQFKRDFQAEHGREWAVQDELNAAKNGAYVIRLWAMDTPVFRHGEEWPCPLSKFCISSLYFQQHL